MKKKIFISIIIIMALISLTACFNNNDAGNNEENGENGAAASGILILATTTSTYDSGILDALIPVFEEQYGFTVNPIAVGTGAALEMGRRGDADVLLTHAPAAEWPLVEEGYVINYRMIMYNDFVIVGPEDDPAGVGGMDRAIESFTRIAESESLFVSRGDNSGTHMMELSIWEDTGVEPGGDWYIETGSGMGQALNVASERDGYTLTDRGTFLALRHNLHLEILVEGDPVFLNIYHVSQVNPEKHNHSINTEGAAAFVEFMRAEETQRIISEFGVDRFGSPLFFPNAHEHPSVYGLNYID